MSNEEILNELGFANGTQEMKNRVVENVRTTVELRVVGVLTELMTDEQEAEFNMLQAKNDNAAVWEWLKSEVAGVDVSEVYEATLKDYIADQKENAFQV